MNFDPCPLIVDYGVPCPHPTCRWLGCDRIGHVVVEWPDAVGDAEPEYVYLCEDHAGAFIALSAAPD